MSYPSTPDNIATVSTGQLITSAYVNAQSNAINNVEAGVGLNPARGLCEGRLTTSSGVPVPTADVTGASSLSLTAFRGNRIGLFDGSSTWNVLAFNSDVNLALSGLVANVNYDVFAFNSSGVVALEALAWQSGVSNNNPASGTNVVIGLTNTSGVAVGDPVTINGGGHNEVAFVTAVVTNTSITVATLVNSYTTPTVYFNSRATILSWQSGTPQNGVLVKSVDTTRRYLGSFRATGGNTTEDSAANRFLFNQYNQVPRHLLAQNSANQTTASAAWAPIANTQISLLVGFQLGSVQLAAISGGAASSGAAGTTAGIGIGVNGSNPAATASLSATAPAATYNFAFCSPPLLKYPGLGATIANAYAQTSAGTLTMIDPGMTGMAEM